jgi:hypothetical protein
MTKPHRKKTGWLPLDVDFLNRYKYEDGPLGLPCDPAEIFYFWEEHHANLEP